MSHHRQVLLLAGAWTAVGCSSLSAGGDGGSEICLPRLVLTTPGRRAIETVARGAPLLTPDAVAVSPAGLVVADAFANRIFLVRVDGGVDVFAGDGDAGLRDGPADQAEFALPFGAIASGEEVLVADTYSHSIRLIADGGVTTIARDLGLVGGLALALDGGLYFASNLGLGLLSDGGELDWLLPGPVADVLSTPQGLFVTFDPQVGVVASGAFSGFAGSGDPGYQDGDGSRARFSYALFHLAADAQGNLYAADEGNNVVRRISPAGDVTTYAGDGPDCGLDGGPGSGEFEEPSGVAVDDAGNVYVADTGHSRIAVIRPQ